MFVVSIITCITYVIADLCAWIGHDGVFSNVSGMWPGGSRWGRDTYPKGSLKQF